MNDDELTVLAEQTRKGSNTVTPGSTIEKQIEIVGDFLRLFDLIPEGQEEKTEKKTDKIRSSFRQGKLGLLSKSGDSMLKDGGSGPKKVFLKDA